jgi:NAD(P)H-hydrate repair Nnr-like enzyme with NAD(P)H-hydrate epimerase domain
MTSTPEKVTSGAAAAASNSIIRTNSGNNPGGGSLRYLTGKEAFNIDVELMSKYAFSIDQLMELAGLSCASAIHKKYPLPSYRRVLIVCGPGNNGGDGLVAARHLTHMGYACSILYSIPQPKKLLYRNLIQQCQQLSIPVYQSLADAVQTGAGDGDVSGASLADEGGSGASASVADDDQTAAGIAAQYDVIVDAIFGFSFKGQPRAPFDAILRALISISHSSSSALSALPATASAQSSPTASPAAAARGLGAGAGAGAGGAAVVPVVVSIDIPSGWPVDGDSAPVEARQRLQPDMLISLTTPKFCALNFRGRYHMLGGRFVPYELQRDYQLGLPVYPGAEQCVELRRVHLAAH